MPLPKKSNNQKPVESTGMHALVAVPRAWLVALTILLVLPWLVVAALYWRAVPATGGRPAPEPTRTAAAPGRVTAAPGPWGTLALTPIIISPPLELVSTDWGPAAEPRWSFPGVETGDLEVFLRASGLAPADVAQVMSTARTDPGTQALVVSPGLGLVRRLDPDTRARVYGLLSRSSLNFDQAQSFRFPGTSIEAWLGGSLIAPSTRAALEPLIYQNDGYLHFADVDVIRTHVTDPGEIRRLAKVLLRQRTLLVGLTIGDSGEVDRLAEYWGRGGRRTDLRPLLESVAGSAERTIDVALLLPIFARTHLYRYPKLSTGDYEKPALANCLWTALNFFADEPDDRALDVNFALERLKTDYYIVEDGFQLGDVVALIDEDNDLFHVVVYLAADLVITKNGMSPVAPWIILPLDEVKRYYGTQTSQPRVIYHRRNDL